MNNDFSLDFLFFTMSHSVLGVDVQKYTNKSSRDIQRRCSRVCPYNLSRTFINEKVISASFLFISDTIRRVENTSDFTQIISSTFHRVVVHGGFVVILVTFEHAQINRFLASINIATICILRHYAVDIFIAIASIIYLFIFKSSKGNLS